MLNAYQDFRLFYNQHIHPELLHLERRRQRLVRLIGLSVFLILCVAALQIYVDLFFITLLLLIPVGVWVAYLYFKVQVFLKEFKPRIVGLILDFIDNDVNFRFDNYDRESMISQKQFLESRIFTTAEDYGGEDYIKGQVRETPFELSELRVKEFSPVRNRLDYVFRGVFLVADYRRWDMHGGVLALPDVYRKYLVRSQKAFHLLGGRRVRQNLLPEFEKVFDTYATPEARIKDIISPEMQRAILQFRKRFQDTNREKELYFSVISDKIYLALTQDRNLLEPSLFANNVSFELIHEFYADLRLLLDVVRDVDVMN